MIAIRREICAVCGACVAICRKNALFLFNMTLLVEESCDSCGSCIDVCPLGAIVEKPEETRNDQTEREL